MSEENQVSAIEVERVTKRFGAVTALDEVSFSVRQGELFFLLGPSGCGKTTMLRILAGLETPDAGRVLFGGKDTASLPPHRRGAPMVFQNYALWPHLKVKDNVAFGLVERKVPKREIEERVRATLCRVELEALGDRMPGQLSGGQQQRVVLARALVLDPAVMLLDEPLSNLDAKLRTEMREGIETLHAETPITFVYVTHDQVEALSLADRLAVMHEGQICAIGTPKELYHYPPNLFCADFLGEANLVRATVKSVSGDRATVEGPHGEWQATHPNLDSLSNGQNVTCLVRPENLGRDSTSEAENRFEADVQALRFNGPTVTVVLSAGGAEWRATLLQQQASGLEAGMRIPWHVAFENTVIIDEDRSKEI